MRCRPSSRGAETLQVNPCKFDRCPALLLLLLPSTCLEVCLNHTDGSLDPNLDPCSCLKQQALLCDTKVIQWRMRSRRTMMARQQGRTTSRLRRSSGGSIRERSAQLIIVCRKHFFWLRGRLRSSTARLIVISHCEQKSTFHGSFRAAPW